VGGIDAFSWIFEKGLLGNCRRAVLGVAVGFFGRFFWGFLDGDFFDFCGVDLCCF
jgi:hypothetical protein